MIKYDGGFVDYDARGEGSAIVLVPGSCATGAAWRAVVARLESSFRCVTTSLLGYGGTTERRTALDPDISYEAEALEAVIRQVPSPVHLVGHSAGGLLAVAVALRNKVPLRSLTIFEAPAPELLRHAGNDIHYRAFREMTDRYFADFRAGDRTAIRTMIDFYGGEGTFAALPPAVSNYLVEKTPVNILDWATAYGFQPTSAALRNIRVPTVVAWGGNSHPAVQRCNELLARWIARTEAVAIPGAAHFMISSHPTQTAQIIARHVMAMEPKKTSARREMVW